MPPLSLRTLPCILGKAACPSSANARLALPTPGPAALLLGLCGLKGVAYVCVVVRRVRRMKGYDPVPEDWAWNGILPLGAYVAAYRGDRSPPGAGTAG
jgi:hypothetical protein